jgi:hypothetical protein
MLLSCKNYFRSLLFIFAVVALNSPASAGYDYVTQLQKAALEQNLWVNPIWINLLHYDVSHQNQLSDIRFLSQVDDDRFFNAEFGKTNSKAELLATIKAFYRTDVRDDQHPQCLFTARLNWLTEQLSIASQSLPVNDCVEYKAWRAIVDADQVTLIFPAYHLNSPSSMFGHTLLRLDKKFGNNESKWLSYAVNFGANTNSVDDNSIFYAFKGLAGGYPGNFIVTPYYKKIQEYNRIENRDIWEYTLDLNAQETSRMITHLWELKEMNFDYFFFDENRSYRLLELLEVARPGIELTDEFILTAIPVDTVRAIERVDMITKIEYRPSQLTKLQQLFDQMSDLELDMVKSISADVSYTKDNSFTSLSQSSQKNIVDASYKYLRYLEKDKSRDSATDKRSFALLRLLNSYPPTVEAVTRRKPISPENSHLSKQV